MYIFHEFIVETLIVGFETVCIKWSSVTIRPISVLYTYTLYIYVTKNIKILAN